ncbi:heterokaryon incompatibility protein-domain-containing protein [Lophiotrema nucula]|uniref:Heterokaryon incompatibility protein-domain-containing protein n=1 Tax=Lophiotrema nucula TaxID=690887 RepID=A0A6A5ZQV9_9PLEO|nr:heterokaryon incompatibility protein-domain-containing protein [Lophiotrema nucula]
MAIVNAPDSCVYVALSYCWGKSWHFVCTRENHGVLSLSGALASVPLPNTIQDAIAVTNAMQIRYLWVDALCITQDDVDMLQSQIPHMDSIYGSAALTIIAASGDNANSGLPGVQVGSRYVIADILRFKSLNLMLCPPDFDNIGVQQSTWRSRAWTMQEELFSARKLYFTPDRMVWSCERAYWSEHESREPSSRSKCVAIAPRVDSNEPRLPESTSTNDYDFDTYRGLVEAFSVRQMGSPSDSLNAFAGIERYLFASGGHQVVWGHPQMWFTRSLQWEMNYETDEHHEMHRLSSSDGSTHLVQFPSWSWSAWGRKTEPNTVYWIGVPSDEDHIKDHEPLLYFYECSKNGWKRRLDEQSDRQRNTHRDSQRTILPDWDAFPVEWVSSFLPDPIGFRRHEKLPSSISAPWRESPLTIDPSQDPVSGSWDVSCGHLKFWSSVGTIYLHRRPKIVAGRPWDYTILNQHGKTISHTINMQANNHMEWLDKSNCKAYPPLTVPQDEAEGLVFDAVVIGMQKPSRGSGESGLRNPNYIKALLIERIDGIAYRRGLVSIAEDEWIGLERKWMLVTLG